MPSSRGLHIAQLAKDAFDKGTTTNMDQHVPLECLLRNSSNTNTLDVPFDSVADATDANYKQWRTVDPRIIYHHNFDTNLKQWISQIRLNKLARLIDRIPKGPVGFDFTPIQLISIITFVSLPFDVTSSITIPVDVIKEMSFSQCPRKKTVPLSAQHSMIKGSFPKVAIIDFPTACGKTAWACAVAKVALSDPIYGTRRWQRG